MIVKTLIAENLMMKARIKELETKNDLKKISENQDKLFEFTRKFLRDVDQNLIDEDNSDEEDDEDEDEDDEDDEEEDVEDVAGNGIEKNRKLRANPIVKNAKIDKVKIIEIIKIILKIFLHIFLFFFEFFHFILVFR